MHYTVHYGDTLGGIASRFGVSVAAIMHANGLHHSMIYPGQRLWIPVTAHHYHPAPQHVQHHYYGH
jgi:LysM repeat protein